MIKLARDISEITVSLDCLDTNRKIEYEKYCNALWSHNLLSRFKFWKSEQDLQQEQLDLFIQYQIQFELFESQERDLARLIHKCQEEFKYSTSDNRMIKLFGLFKPLKK